MIEDQKNYVKLQDYFMFLCVAAEQWKRMHGLTVSTIYAVENGLYKLPEGHTLESVIKFRDSIVIKLEVIMHEYNRVEYYRSHDFGMTELEPSLNREFFDWFHRKSMLNITLQ